MKNNDKTNAIDAEKDAFLTTPRFGQKKQNSTPQSPQSTLMDTLSSGLLLVQRFGTVAVIGYVFLGEVLLPSQLRASTFIATRMIHISELQKLDLAKESAQAITTEEVAKARVTYSGKCQLDRQSTAMTIYSNCLSQDNKSVYQCQFYRELYLENTPCEEMPDAPLVEKMNEDDV